ncbi:MAG: hypothetical protein AAGG44_13605 [Planctomycetota bacterium]
MNFSSAFIAGQLLLWLGFLGGSLASVLRLENEASPWQTIPWFLYGSAFVIGVIGVLILRADKASKSAEDSASETGLTAVKEHLANGAEAVARLHGNLSEMTCEDVLEYIDTECVPHFAEFAEGRSTIANRFGNMAYAEVMTEFASGERYVNRAWSAAADGYVDEVEASVAHAHAFMQAANTCLAACQEKQT